MWCIPFGLYFSNVILDDITTKLFMVFFKARDDALTRVGYKARIYTKKNNKNNLKFSTFDNF